MSEVPLYANNEAKTPHKVLLRDLVLAAHHLCEGFGVRICQGFGVSEQGSSLRLVLAEYRTALRVRIC